MHRSDGRSLVARSPVAALAIAFVFLAADRHDGRAGAAPLQEIPGAPAGTDLFAGQPWGPVDDGVQLRLAPAWAATERAARDGLFPLALEIRNASAIPVPFDQQRVSYALEYEIDGTWYAFEKVDTVRNYSELQPAFSRNLVAAQAVIRPNTVRGASLLLPLRGRSRYLALGEIGPNGQGRRLTISAGTHVVRVRPGASAFGSPRAMAAVSNSITVTIPPIRVPAASVVAWSPDSLRTSLRQTFRFVDAPGDSRVIAQDALKQPWSVSLANTPRLADFDDLHLLEPIGLYTQALPRRLDASNPSLPSSPTTRFVYPVVAAGEGVASVLLELNQRGDAHVISLSGQQAAAPLVRTLSQLTTTEQVRAGDYEPRLLEVNRYRGSLPLTVFWLRSRSDRPDLFYYAQSTDARIKTRLESERLYSADEFFKAARELVVTPMRTEAWAIDAAIVCAKNAKSGGGGPLLLDQATVEIGFNDVNGKIVWYVQFPERIPERILFIDHPGASFVVDEMTGACTQVYAS